MRPHDWLRAAWRDTLGRSRNRPLEMTGPRARPPRQPASRRRIAAALSLAFALSACETLAPPPPAPAPTASIAALYLQPAERSLVDGIRLYEEASFDRAEIALRLALDGGLADPRDRAVACKYIAFIACAFDRITECEDSFRSAFAADPAFALTDTEIGHPLWGPVYRRIAAGQRRQ
jgi:hypothetical protein